MKWNQRSYHQSHLLNRLALWAGQRLKAPAAPFGVCTPSLAATPLTLPTPNSYSLRICSNSSPSALLSIPASCLISRMPRLRG